MSIAFTCQEHLIAEIFRQPPFLICTYVPMSSAEGSLMSEITSTWTGTWNLAWPAHPVTSRRILLVLSRFARMDIWTIFLGDGGFIMGVPHAKVRCACIPRAIHLHLQICGWNARAERREAWAVQLRKKILKAWPAPDITRFAHITRMRNAIKSWFRLSAVHQTSTSR